MDTKKETTYPDKISIFMVMGFIIVYLDVRLCVYYLSAFVNNSENHEVHNYLFGYVRVYAICRQISKF